MQKLSAEIAAALNSDAVRQQFEKLLFDPAPMSPAAFAGKISEDLDRYSKVARTAGIEKQ